jgi:ubiquinone/menaquinone biosynthesis C-methylase UbiE
LLKTEIKSKIEARKDKIRKHFLKYTRQAFQLFPRMKDPHILDVGCGSGIPTIELAKMSKGRIIGIDTDQHLLDILAKRIKEEGLSKQVVIKNCSLFDIDFPEETFDIIWAEGSIWIIGFSKGLQVWNPLLKPKGFLVVHDSIRTFSNELDVSSKLGYILVDHFELPEDAWLKQYCEPLEIIIKEQSEKAKDNITLKRLLDEYQNEVNIIRKNPKDNMSAFYIFQKL